MSEENKSLTKIFTFNTLQQAVHFIAQVTELMGQFHNYPRWQQNGTEIVFWFNDDKEHGNQMEEFLTKLENLHVQIKSDKIDDNNTTKNKKENEIKLYADGGSRGNPGPSASGYALLDMSDDIIIKKGIYLGITTNNQAEYQALKLGLEEALRIEADTVNVYMDSLLVINQMIGKFKVKNRDLWPIHNAIKIIARDFKRVNYTHVPRELNKLADSMVNKALDDHLKL